MAKSYISYEDALKFGEEISVDGKPLKDFLEIPDTPKKPTERAAKIPASLPRKTSKQIASISFENFSIDIPKEDVKTFIHELDNLMSLYSFEHGFCYGWKIENISEE